MQLHGFILNMYFLYLQKAVTGPVFFYVKFY
jgi:hypothetical protein